MMIYTQWFYTTYYSAVYLEDNQGRINGFVAGMLFLNLIAISLIVLGSNIHTSNEIQIFALGLAMSQLITSSMWAIVQRGD